MKKLLSLLLVFVFLQSEVWALSGGPVFSLNSVTSTQGTFAGVVIPVSSTSNTATTQDIANSLGVFSIGIPQVGLASGVFVYFSNGQTFTGTIVGTADPEKLTLQALVKAQFNITTEVSITDTTTGTTAPVASALETVPGGFANGSLQAEFRADSGGAFATVGASLVRLKGKATLEVQSANTATGAPVGAISNLELSVDGFQQSATQSQAVDISALTNTTSAASTTGSTTTTGG
jgi:hypothetical protein